MVSRPWDLRRGPSLALATQERGIVRPKNLRRWAPFAHRDRAASDSKVLKIGAPSPTGPEVRGGPGALDLRGGTPFGYGTLDDGRPWRIGPQGMDALWLWHIR